MYMLNILVVRRWGLLPTSWRRWLGFQRQIYLPKNKNVGEYLSRASISYIWILGLFPLEYEASLQLLCPIAFGYKGVYRRTSNHLLCIHTHTNESLFPFHHSFLVIRRRERWWWWWFGSSDSTYSRLSRCRGRLWLSWISGKWSSVLITLYSYDSVMCSFSISSLTHPIFHYIILVYRW